MVIVSLVDEKLCVLASVRMPCLKNDGPFLRFQQDKMKLKGVSKELNAENGPGFHGHDSIQPES